MKLIGITSRFNKDTSDLFVRKTYLDYVKKDFVPVIIPFIGNIDGVLEKCDAFLITGGLDISPCFFNEERNLLGDYSLEGEDLLDKRIIEHASETKKPVLGICRGIQSINVFLGGTLKHHIEGHNAKDKNQLFVPTGKGTYLSQIFKDKFFINSFHHQSISKLAPNLVCAGYSNGEIEAVEHESLPIIGVQWHPERLNDSNSAKIIELFKRLVYDI